MASSQTFTLNIKAVANMQDVVSNIQQIQNALTKLKMPEGLKTSFSKIFNDLDKETGKYQELLTKGFKTKGDVSAFTKSGDNILRLYDELVSKINSIDDSALKNMFKDMGTQEIQKLKQELASLQESLKTQLDGKNFAAGFKKGLQDIKDKFKDTDKAASELAAKLQKSTFNTFTKNLSEGRLDLAVNNLKSIKEQVAGLQNPPQELIDWVEKLDTAFNKLAGDANIQATINQLEQIKGKLTGEEAKVIQDLINSFKQFQGTVSASNDEAQKFVTTEQQAANSTATFNRELDQVKSRIQYFFGLSNAINLVRRAIRGAVETVKELDKAMTETAVVTNYTVKDMWNQLPEYTKRANELGVMTKDAYESATLYFQQGLNADQAAALSTETLKMARIAGLDAAEATDRMTNALRGFNMELDTASAQRVDDVYSQLAAMSASNVDEISTAMTKVASLAHSANMEFESTAAFLAQIIETTRESAETAGTALKTVVARFSEVKKLVDTDQLKGQDEEGQVIDVNKVSAALRTAGIDLNKYFLGEVGLDDIFMELASKWDSLTSVQQRYIATQAAGSRQQSRFIALMQDYARTQELVGAAYNAEGASARQFEKTQDSLQSKLARLKNAWNEFLMGITNSGVIKGAVDALTLLLNVINKITGAFGPAVSGFLKFGVAAATVFAGKSAFSDKGIATKAIGALLNNTSIGRLLGVGGNVQSPSTASGQAPKGPTLISGIGNIGKGLWNGAKSFGSFMGFGTGGNAMAGLLPGAEFTGSAGLIAGLGGIATAAVAITALYLAIKGIYALTPEGKLKKAQKEAEKAKKELEEADKNLKSKKGLQETYQEQTAKVENATTAADRQAAVEERNQAILDAIQKDGTLAQYVVTEKVEDSIILTIDEDTLANAIDAASEAAKNAAAQLQFGEATVDYRQAEVYKNQLKSIFASVMGLSPRDAGSLNYTAEELYKQILNAPVVSNKNLQRAAELYTSYTSAMGGAGQKVKIGYGQQLAQLGVSDELTNALIPILGQAFVETGKEIKLNQLDNLLGTGEKSLLSFLDAYSGKNLDQNLLRINVGNEEELYKLYGLDTSSEELANIINELAAVTGKSTDEIRKQVIQQAKVNKLIQSKQQYQTSRKMFEGGASGEAIRQYLTLENYSDQQIFEKLYSSFDTSFISDELINSLIQGIKDKDTVLTDWLKNIDLSNPISAFEELSDKAKNAEGSVQTVAKQLLEVGKASGQFSAESQLNYFLLSESYASLLEELDKFREENGKITSSNVIELAKSNKDLNSLLESNIISAKGLSAALTGIETGKIYTWDLTDAIIAALNAMDDLDGIVKRTIDDLGNFDPGYDENDVASFINKTFDLSKENIEKGAYGNNQMRNYMEYLFGSYTDAPGDEYQAWLKNNLATLEANKDNMKAAWTEIAGSSADAAAEYSEGIKVWQENGEIIVDAAGHTTEELITILSKETGATEQWMRMMIADFKNYSDDFALTVEQADANKAIEAWVNEIGDRGYYLDTELQALAHLLNKDVDEIRAAVEGLAEISLGEGTWQEIINALAQIQGLGGNVDLTNRPSIDASKLKEAGWLKAGEGTATVYSSTYANEAGTIYANFTPITPDGKILTPEALDQYASEVLEGVRTDDLKLQIGATFDSEEAADQAAKAIHEIQNILYTDGAVNLDYLKQSLMDADLGQYFESVVNQMAKDGKEFTMGFGEDLQDIVPNLGETYLEAYTRLQQEAKDTKFIEELKTAFSEFEITIDTEKGTIQLQEFTEEVDEETGETREIPIEINDKASDALTDLLLSLQAKANKGVSIPITAGASSKAKGGVVGSYGSGSFRTSPGPALTGEEGPEIVWNKEKGYAYITGQNHPQFQDLQPGDRIFNAQETRKILSMARGGSIPSNAVNSYADDYHGYGDAKTGSSGGGGSGDKKSSSEWRNELDWLYDLMEDIAEYERQQSLIQDDYDLALKDLAKTGRDLYNLTKDELENLQAQREGQEGAQAKRLQQMLELQSEVNKAGYDQYIQYNQKDRTLEIDWDAIEAIQDKDTYDEVVDYLKRMETVQDQMDDAEQALKEIDKRIQELEERFLQKYLEFQNRVLEAVVKQYQDAIDNLSELNSSLDDTNQSILDSIQKEIDLERQIRDNTDTESDIADMEARLAYLQRDTTGANDTEIRGLQKQLADARENYSDTLIDQAIERLSQNNEEASEQRNKQVELMQAQLDYWKESGGLWEEVENLIATGFNSDGQLILGSELEKVLRNAENYDAMSKAQRENWANELILETNEVGAYIIKLNEGMDLNAGKIRALLEEISGKMGGTPEHSFTTKKDSDNSGGSGGGSDGGGSGDGSGSGRSERSRKWSYVDDGTCRLTIYYTDGSQTNQDNGHNRQFDHWENNDAIDICTQCKHSWRRKNARGGGGRGSGGLKMMAYATGGLATQTGPAWLDGTPSEPEYVLNARQTNAFLRLAEVLPAVMNGGAPTTANYGGDIYLDLSMHVDEIASDYDVDRIADRVKEIIYDASSYRNVNTLNFIR